jgi:hypothetical protein
MFVVLGRKTARAHRGWIADFCPVCRELRAFTVTGLFSVRHVYFLSAGGEQFVGNELRCSGCQTRFGHMSIPASVSEESINGATGRLLHIAEATSPRGADQLRRRHEQEQRCRSGQLGPGERHELLCEPFWSLDYLAGVMSHRGTHRSVTALIGSVAVISGCAAVILFSEWSDRRYPSARLTGWLVGAVVSTVGFGVYAAYRTRIAGRLACEQSVMKPLIRALSPMRVKREELESLIHDLRAEGSAVAAGLNPAAVWRELEVVQASRN